MKKVFAILILLAIMAMGLTGLAFAGVVSTGEAIAYASCCTCAFGVALAGERDTNMRKGDSISIGLAAATIVYKGGLGAIDANGNAVPGSTATTLLGAGRFETTVDNSGGIADDEVVEIRKGIFNFGNSAAGDAITDADIGADCYIVDDQTVAKTDGGATRSVAGKVFKVDSDGVWVKFE